MPHPRVRGVHPALSAYSPFPPPLWPLTHRGGGAGSAMTVDTTRDDVRERAFVRSSLHVRERQRTLSLILGARYNIPSTVVDIIIAYDRENTTMALSGAATVIQSYYRASVDVRYAQGLRAASESTLPRAHGVLLSPHHLWHVDMGDRPCSVECSFHDVTSA